MIWYIIWVAYDSIILGRVEQEFEAITMDQDPANMYINQNPSHRTPEQWLSTAPLLQPLPAP
jgi:hypothetical protein